MMGTRSIVLDSHAVMIYLQREKGFQRIIQILKEAEKGQTKIFLNLINWGEIYYATYRSHGEKAAEETLLLIEELPITLVTSDRALIYLAARFKSQHAIAYGDCFAAAMAQREKCPVLTGDKEFKKLEGQILISWI